MSLATLFRDLAQQMLTPGGIFDDVPVEVVYIREASADYNPVTQIVTVNETRYPVTGVYASPSIRQVDNVNVLFTDRLLYIAGKTFLEAGLTMRTRPDDTVEFDGGEVWKVVRIDTDSVNACYIIYLRQP